MDSDQNDDKTKIKPLPSKPQVSRGLGEKEKEAAGLGKEALEEVGKEIEPPKEIKEVGVKLKKEEIKLPPAIEKLGVKPSGPATPLPSSSTITLPLTDDQLVKALTFPIFSSLRWLAEFCLRQLKKAHISLKRVRGKSIRVEV